MAADGHRINGKKQALRQAQGERGKGGGPMAKGGQGTTASGHRPATRKAKTPGKAGQAAGGAGAGKALTRQRPPQGALPPSPTLGRERVKKAAKTVSKKDQSANGDKKAELDKFDTPTRKQATGKTVAAVLSCLRLGMSYTETAAKTGFDRTHVYNLRRQHPEDFASAEEEGARADLHDADATRREIMLDIAADPHARLKAVDLTQRRRQAATLDVRVTVGEPTDWEDITPQAMQAAIARQVGRGGQGG